MKTFEQSFFDVDALSQTERKPLVAMAAKLFEEGGELAECVNIQEGFITHKAMKEPLVGEVADVVQVALSILVKATPCLTPQQRMDLFLEHFERKNSKWAAVQEGETAAEADDDTVDTRKAYIQEPRGSAHDIEKRVARILVEQLGIGKGDVRPSAHLADDLGADSLDLVELCMALEDEFEFEVSDADAEKIKTVSEINAYIKGRFGIKEYSDPAADYTERSGRYLSLNERMQERSVHRNELSEE